MKTMILSGFGTNCEQETVYACQRAGATQVQVVHISTLYAQEPLWRDFDLLVLIGGFLDGDDLGAARACANRFRYKRLMGGGTVLHRLQGFVDSGRLLLGICNGFQLLVKLGLLPGLTEHGGAQRVTLTTNEQGKFEDRWVQLRVNGNSPCVFTRGMEKLELPVRHGEGRLAGARRAELNALVERQLVPLQYADSRGEATESYPANPNGSTHGIAALCNPRGTVLGLMPHPEGYNHFTNHPRWTRREQPGESIDGEGLLLFRNAYDYLHSHPPLPL